MNYIDTDVLIHSLVIQDQNLHLKVNDLIEKMIIDNSFCISLLSVQETAFVLAKLGQPISFVESKVDYLLSSAPVAYQTREFKRALELAKIIGFKDFNHCLHTAIAEQNCTELYTFNYKDFKRIQPHTKLNIHFL